MRPIAGIFSHSIAILMMVIAGLLCFFPSSASASVISPTLLTNIETYIQTEANAGSPPLNEYSPEFLLEPDKSLKKKLKSKQTTSSGVFIPPVAARQLEIELQQQALPDPYFNLEKPVQVATYLETMRFRI